MAFHNGQLVIVRGVRGRRIAKGTVTYSDRHGAIIDVEGHGSLYIQRRRIDPTHCIAFGMYHVEPITRETLARYAETISSLFPTSRNRRF